MNQIYISYAWKDNKSELGSKREELVDKICAALISERYNLIRDRSYLTLGKSIHDFMQEIGRGNYVIVVVSDKYLRSEYCMFEAVKIMKCKDYEQKVFPVVLQDANVYTKEGQSDYINYWKQQKEKLKELIGSEVSPNGYSAMHNVAEKIIEISQKIDEFMFFISDKLSIDPSIDFNGFINQLTDAIKDDAVKLRSKKSILVAGTGGFNIPNEINWCAQKLGEKIAEYNYNLITGGWDGVDYVVADKFAEKITQQDIRLTDKLTHVVPRGKQPVFKGGKVEYTESGINEWLDCLRYSDLVILLGGVGGTYNTYLYAKQEKIPVIPIVCTNGDAKRVFDEMLANWDSKLMANISPEKFKSLNQYINDPSTAEDVVNDVMDIVNEIIFAKTMLNTQDKLI
ncbi:MAG: toll/interleukin-1 receptor domain-containing protein [Nostoc sp. DedVER02]|uniref:toll/interleukin-1 receptor domain-containing protein n=1 Tax=unclassified Nostoc TaxID=2593658 RepID=UPI002AD59781|nr:MULTISPECIES: TIR domain-containing protein [unclassified Nostoc]MDZ7985911.1 TIR domain-containing protein [Nostoc sp. DedVER02]MDZ8111530.1 TIR domain-containing protein [Nostoc sp. DedVER01b]